MSIFDELARERLLFNEPPTGPIPVITAGEDDEWVPTRSQMPPGVARLRPADLELEQPPQDPAWRPDADR